MLWSAIGASIFPGASDESKLLAIDYCKSRGLDIMKKPCHIVPMNVKDTKTNRYEWRDVIMPGIAEQRITASRTGQYAGQDPPVFGDNVELLIGGNAYMVPEYCTIVVYRLVNGERVPFAHTEWFEEACGTTKDGTLNSMWTKRKRGQLAKCAEAGALRKAFPEELGGIITVDEVTETLEHSHREASAKVTMQETNPWAEESKPESKPAATETAKTEEAVETEASFASEEATSMPSRKEMAAEVKEAMAQAEITLPAAEARLRAAGLLAEGKTLSKTTDDELFAITQNLGAILNPEPAKA